MKNILAEQLLSCLKNSDMSWGISNLWNKPLTFSYLPFKGFTFILQFPKTKNPTQQSGRKSPLLCSRRSDWGICKRFVTDKINQVSFPVACIWLVSPRLENTLGYSFGIHLRFGMEALEKQQDCKHRFITDYYKEQTHQLRCFAVVNSPAPT